MRRKLLRGSPTQYDVEQRQVPRVLADGTATVYLREIIKVAPTCTKFYINLVKRADYRQRRYANG